MDLSALQNAASIHDRRLLVERIVASLEGKRVLDLCTFYRIATGPDPFTYRDIHKSTRLGVKRSEELIDDWRRGGLLLQAPCAKTGLGTPRFQYTAVPEFANALREAVYHLPHHRRVPLAIKMGLLKEGADQTTFHGVSSGEITLFTQRHISIVPQVLSLISTSPKIPRHGRLVAALLDRLMLKGTMTKTEIVAFARGHSVKDMLIRLLEIQVLERCKDGYRLNKEMRAIVGFLPQKQLGSRAKVGD